ncbi:hypothetical protein GGX14DRAFT_394018 [Mycena pura]|uniref:Uncharacterized protein n=1 Tax=Mycena pura TaxID=153505 RepID=A0AAD6VFT0_9AGAR|nr:hypothetical protein GGX14DRAFT_394018 [Mycena pura]
MCNGLQVSVLMGQPSTALARHIHCGPGLMFDNSGSNDWHTEMIASTTLLRMMRDAFQRINYTRQRRRTRPGGTRCLSTRARAIECLLSLYNWRLRGSTFADVLRTRQYRTAGKSSVVIRFMGREVKLLWSAPAAAYNDPARGTSRSSGAPPSQNSGHKRHQQTLPRHIDIAMNRDQLAKHWNSNIGCLPTVQVLTQRQTYIALVVQSASYKSTCVEVGNVNAVGRTKHAELIRSVAHVALRAGDAAQTEAAYDDEGTEVTEMEYEGTSGTMPGGSARSRRRSSSSPRSEAASSTALDGRAWASDRTRCQPVLSSPAPPPAGAGAVAYIVQRGGQRCMRARVPLERSVHVGVPGVRSVLTAVALPVVHGQPLFAGGRRGGGELEADAGMGACARGGSGGAGR